MMKPFKTHTAFFFDFDGVLADSVEVKTRAFSKLFEKFGSEIQANVVAHHRNNGGMTRKDKFKYYYKHYLKKRLCGEALEALCGEFADLVVENVVSAPEISGSERFLKKWHDLVKCFVVSASPDAEIVEITKRRGINHYFHEVLGSSRSKTDHVTLLIEKYNLNPDHCLFWGDAGSDYRAAIETGVGFIGILPDSNAPLLKTAPDILWYNDFSNLLTAD